MPAQWVTITVGCQPPQRAEATKPPTTWAEVREAAKKSTALGPGYVGHGKYSAGDTGGWHFTAELYGRGGDVVTPDGRKAAFNSPTGRAVLQTLKDMRWTDGSMGTKQLLRWEDLMRLVPGGSAPGASATVTASAGIRDAGAYTVAATADAADDSIELNETETPAPPGSPSRRCPATAWSPARSPGAPATRAAATRSPSR
ncbi:extracellular solute-binding protein [Actinomadura keratinilytica]|jgi:hypothetical protein|uniref:Uncharacterized protein n=1 Tax=Actinomadura keratinilytica TaxID=547461 RepID=A0ABP7Z3W3_9ACTN